ncbi:MAG: histidine kinase dimerization/phosphoacceptor domain-containing protein [Actinomycetota bacterium]|nr:histidine kinase dimerization/phosphoacceptor domain-containing protein [Actinomycetota bacterium]
MPGPSAGLRSFTTDRPGDQIRPAGRGRDRAREQETQRRVDAERLRIARELHDVVAHNISLINVQATMGVHFMDERPGEATAALAAIKAASKHALRELRRILDVLRQAEEAEPTAPAPGLAELDSLIVSTTRPACQSRCACSANHDRFPPPSTSPHSGSSRSL